MRNEAQTSKPEVRPATREDFVELANNLRPEDAREVSLATGFEDPKLGVMLCRVVSTEAFAIVQGDALIAIFGVTGVPGQFGFPWMLATPLLKDIRKTFLRECRKWVQAMLSVYGRLENYVWSGNELHIQWLRWMGFKIDPATPFGVFDEPFHHFSMSRYV